MHLIKTTINRIYEVDSFQKEFCDTCGIPKTFSSFTSSSKNKYIKWLTLALSRLDYCIDSDMHLPEYEYIETYHDGKMYSIRNTKLPKNPRILYIYYPEKNIIILLCVFAEKHKNIYNHYKQVARKRIDILSEDKGED